MDTRVKMAKEHLRSLLFLTVFGSHWLVCYNREAITHQGVCQVEANEFHFF